MRSVKTVVLAAAAAFALPALTIAEPTTWTIDATHSSAGFSVRHMMVTNVRGHFRAVSGTVRLDGDDPTTAVLEVHIDPSSIDTGEAKRDDHLRNADFFDVASHPTMTFRSKRVERAGEGRLKVTGDLTMRGVTREVILDVEGPTPEVVDGRGNARVGAQAQARINRKDFGLAWSRALETGGVVVGDEVQILLDVALVKQAPQAAAR